MTRPGLLLRAWMAWDRLYARMVGALPVTKSVHLAPYVYRGPDRMIDGQVALQPGDRCAEVHFRSEVLTEMAEGRDRAKAGWRQVRQDMVTIARLWAEDPRFQDVKGLTAITLFHRLTARLGFHAEAVEPAWRRRFFSWYMRLIMRVYGGSAAATVTREVRFIWTTREEFIERTSGG